MVKSLAREVRDRLFCGAEPQLFERWRFRYRVRERWRDRWPSLPKLMSTLITPTARDRAPVPLPASLSFLYYLIRPARLVAEYALAPLRRTFTDRHTPKHARAGGA